MMEDGEVGTYESCMKKLNSIANYYSLKTYYLNGTLKSASHIFPHLIFTIIYSQNIHKRI